ncbi:hypothetical protein G7Y89_g9992 [Cudoniella acicularis]|uniref:Uncharacterized protein n=1 Tax=Cudoniella acicularis TaxID=354080 RepID=A0A8H4RFX2_9HELO|nr:hypothetical protein G7Y89_g9992 [Cudoniella acicularis]
MFPKLKYEMKVSIDAYTPCAGFERDSVVVLDGHDPYTDANDTFRDQLWLDINVDDGMIALPDEYVEEMGLPISQRFPWDDSKGIYLLQAYHNIHYAMHSATMSFAMQMISQDTLHLILDQKLATDSFVSVEVGTS